MSTFTGVSFRFLALMSLLATGCAPETKAPDWTYDFGSVPLGASVTLPFELFNPGPSDRVIDDLDLETDSDELSLEVVTGTAPLLLASGGQMRLEVTYDPADDVLDEATFRAYGEDGAVFVAVFTGVGEPLR